jgi:hypothetical protein
VQRRAQLDLLQQRLEYSAREGGGGGDEAEAEGVGMSWQRKWAQIDDLGRSTI